MERNGVGGPHAKANEGKLGGTPASAKPITESDSVKRRHSRGLSTASGVDSKDEDDESGVRVRRRRGKRGGVLGVMESAANWLVGGLIWVEAPRNQPDNKIRNLDENYLRFRRALECPDQRRRQVLSTHKTLGNACKRPSVLVLALVIVLSVLVCIAVALAIDDPPPL